MSLNFSYETSLADYAHYDQASINFITSGDVRQNNQLRENVYGLIFMLLFLIVTAILTTVLNVGFSVFSFVMGIFFYIFITRYRVRRLRNKITPSPQCSLFGAQKMTLEEKGISVETPLTSTSVSWQAVSDFQEDDDYFYVFFDSLRGFYIPKRSLDSDALKQEIREYLNARVNRASRD